MTVRITRFRCSGCRAIVYAQQPFYLNIRVGSPVVDLCVTLSARMLYYARVSTYLQQIGVYVDRWSVRTYAMKNLKEIPTTEQYGIMLPLSIVSLASLASETRNGSSIEMSDVLLTCDYPSELNKEIALGKT